MQRLVVLTLVILIACAPMAQAQWAVVDVAAIAQSLENTIQTAAVVANTAREVETQYNIILNQAKQYETMILNLKRLPEGWDLISAITGWSSQMSGLLGTAKMLSYNLGTVSQQFRTLYQEIGVLGTSADVLTLRRRLLDGRMEVAHVTTLVTAQQENIGTLATRMCGLLNAAQTVDGALGIAQVQALQNGLIQQTMEANLAVQAAHARLLAQSQAEEAALERVRLEAIEKATSMEMLPFTPRGELPKASW